MYDNCNAIDIYMWKGFQKLPFLLCTTVVYKWLFAIAVHGTIHRHKEKNVNMGREKNCIKIVYISREEVHAVVKLCVKIVCIPELHVVIIAHLITKCIASQINLFIMWTIRKYKSYMEK